MANVIIKSDERKRQEDQILRDFHGDSQHSIDREAAECIAAKSREALEEMKRMER